MASPSAQFGSASRGMALLGGCLLLLAGAAQLHLLKVRVYDPDEFEHLHAGLCWARGELPYRDFFEHHGPLTYLVGAGSARLAGPVIDLLTLNRFLSLICVALTLWGTVACARQLLDNRVGVWPAVYLATFPWFVEKGVEWRPDVLALPFLTWAVWCLLPNRSGRIPASRLVLSGLFLGLASTCTLKIAYLCLGWAVGLTITLRANGERLARPLACWIAAGLAPWFGLVLWFAAHGASRVFVERVIVLPLTWGVHEPWHNFITSPISWSPIHFALATLGLVVILVRGLGDASRRRGTCLIWIAPLLHYLAIPWVSAVFLQYYLLGLPMLAILASAGMRRLCEHPSRILRYLPFLVVASFFGAGVCLLPDAAPRNLVQQLWQNLRHEGWRSTREGSRLYWAGEEAGLLLLAVGGVLWLVALKCRRLRPLGAAMCWIALALPTVNRLYIPHVYWSNAGQIADLEFMRQAVPLDQPILDGFSGMGCFHRHAHYWWWLNQHSIPLLHQEKMAGELHQLIRAGKPAAVIIDLYVREFWTPLAGDLLKQYRPLPGGLASGGLIFLRKDLAVPQGHPARGGSNP